MILKEGGENTSLSSLLVLLNKLLVVEHNIGSNVSTVIKTLSL